MTGTGRAAQREQTTLALIAAAHDLVRDGAAVTMPAAARAAQVSEATAYRHFADLAALLTATEAEFWPQRSPAAAEPPLDGTVERVRDAASRTVRTVIAAQTAIRPLIAASVNRPSGESDGAAHRSALVRDTLPSASSVRGSEAQTALERLQRSLDVVVSAESVYALLDQRGMPADEVVEVIADAAAALCRAALPVLDGNVRETSRHRPSPPG